jgi:hypothetical protein
MLVGSVRDIGLDEPQDADESREDSKGGGHGEKQERI